jgi:hypothetical protein
VLVADWVPVRAVTFLAVRDTEHSWRLRDSRFGHHNSQVYPAQGVIESIRCGFQRPVRRA